MEQVLRLFLLKLQSTEGTPETELNRTHLYEAEPGSKIDPNYGVTEIETVGGGYDQDTAVVGKKQCDVTLISHLRPFGDPDSGITPDWVTALRAARFSLVSNNTYFTLRPSNTVYTDATIWEYSGDLNSSAALLRKAGNAKFGWKITFDFTGDNTAKLELTGPAAYTKVANATQPGVTKNRTNVPSLTGVTMQLNGDSDYRVLQLEINGNQSIDLSTKPSDSTGTGKAFVTSRKIKGTAKVYMDVTGTTDPETALEGLTEGLSQITFGTNNGIIIGGNYVQITGIKQSDEAGVQCYDLDLQFNRNDFYIRVKGGTSSSSSSSSSSASY